MTVPRLDIDEFVAETRELLLQFDEAANALRGTESTAALLRARRALHTIKGNARLFGLHVIELVAHTIESALDDPRSPGQLAGSADGLLAAGDFLGSLLDDVTRSNEVDPAPLFRILQTLTRTTAADDARPQAHSHAQYNPASVPSQTFWLNVTWKPGETAAASPLQVVRSLSSLGVLLRGAVTTSAGNLDQELQPQAVTLRVLMETSEPSERIAVLFAPMHLELELATEVPADTAATTGTLVVDWMQRAKTTASTPLAWVRQLAALGSVVDGTLVESPQASLDTPLSAESLRANICITTTRPLAEVGAALGVEIAEAGAEPPRVRQEIHPPPREPATEPEKKPGALNADLLAANRDVERPTSVRISTVLLDRLMDLTGELVIVRNQAISTVDVDDAKLRPLVLRMHSVTRDLQEAVMRTRMQPISIIFRRFPRLIRDLARQLGKEIELVLTGEDVELDRSVLEVLADPLVHLVRNSADHGIESPQRRLAAGKPALGRIELIARHESGRIHVEIVDDGGGINPEAVSRKALAMGLRTQVELDAMTPKERTEIVLLPGFSTAEYVTDVSGRGVGMDVVKTNLEELGGQLTIDSAPGKGTRIELELPLTLAIVPCLLVTIGARRYAVPQKDVDEVVCLHPDLSTGRLERSVDQEVYRLRGKLIPVVRLSNVFSRQKSRSVSGAIGFESSTPSVESPQLLTMLIAKAGQYRYGLIVDSILGSEEVVLKPLQHLLKPIACFSGATILGDGDVVLVVDTVNVARYARLPLGREDLGAPVQRRRSSSLDTQPFLLFAYGPEEQFAVPLQDVRRLDRIDVDQVERIAGEDFVVLDGTSTRLLRLEEMLDVSRPVEDSNQFLILPRRFARAVGLLVTKIIDTVDLSLDLQAGGDPRPGVLGVAVVNDRLTLVLELNELLGVPAKSPTASGALSILVVDDSEFFRQLISAYLRGAGYIVETAENGADGLQKLRSGNFVLAVSDIEMPVLDGLGFARGVRTELLMTELPLLAMTSLSGEADRQRAFAAGFNHYEVKLNRDRLLTAVAELLASRIGAAS